MIMTQTILTGCIVEEEVSMTLEELCRSCSVEIDYIVSLVDEGILEPDFYTLKNEVNQWQFTGNSLQKVQIAWRLQHDLSINTAGVALAFELLEKIDK